MRRNQSEQRPISGIALPRFHGSLRQHLVVLVLAAVVPMFVWAAGLTVWNSYQERRAIERGLTEAAQALSMAVDQTVQLSLEALATASLSRVLAEGDYERFSLILRQLATRHPDWLTIFLVGHSGHVLSNSLIPYGPPLPRLTDRGLEIPHETFQTVLATGNPAISNVFVDPLTRRHVVALAVPVTGFDGVITHVLMAGIAADELAELFLKRHGVAPHWVVGLLDRNHAVIARTIDYEQTVGKRALEWFVQASAGAADGIASGPSLHGPKFTFAYRRSDVTGWTVVFGAPREVFLTTLRGTAPLTGGFGLVVLTVSLALAMWFASRILRPVRALNEVAAPFIAPGEHRRSVYSVTELDDLHQALDGLAVALAASETRFRDLFSTAPVMLEVIDGDGRVQEVNDRWLRTMDYERHEVLGQRPWAFMAPKSRDYAEHVAFAELLKEGAVEDVSVQFVTRSGDARDMLVSARMEKNADGKVWSCIWALRDVTDQRRAERAAARAIEAAEQANDAKTRFLAAASHDLRQPLQALTLYLGVLNARVGEREPQILNAVGKCVDSLSALLNDMLDMARLEAGTITPKPAVMHVRELMERVAAAWRIQAESKGLSLRFLNCDVMVRTDPALLERVLSNLVANAVRYTDKGRILVGCRRAGPGAVRIEVWDTGIGIPADKLDSIFEEFRQLGNPERRRDKGTGLGLSIVQRIARLLGHEIMVRSQPGKGSVFAITVPAVPVGAVGDRPGPDRREGQTRDILIVEDEAEVRSALEMVLSGLGHHVAAVETVDEAVAEAEAACPQLVIADFRLGAGRTGLDAIQAVRTCCGVNMPAVILTGDTDPATIRHIVGAGMHLLYKPLQVEALQNFLRQVA